MILFQDKKGSAHFLTIFMLHFLYNDNYFLFSLDKEQKQTYIINENGYHYQ